MTQRYAHLGASQIREAVCRPDALLRPLQGPEFQGGKRGRKGVGLGFVLLRKVSRPCGSDFRHERRSEVIAGEE